MHRHLIHLLAAAISFVGLVLAQHPQPKATAPIPHLSYLGCVKCDPAVPQYATGQIAWRAKTKWLYMMGHTGPLGEAYAMTLPATWGSEAQTAPRMKLAATVPASLLAQRSWPNLTPDNTLDVGHLVVQGLFCTSDDRLIATYCPNYINDLTGAPFALVLSHLDNTPPTVAGPYKTANGLAHRLGGYCVEFTLDWQERYGATGKRFGFGCPMVSGTTNASHGPGIWLTSDFGKALDLGETLPALDFPQAHWCAVPETNYIPIRKDPTTGLFERTSTAQFELPADGMGYFKTTDQVWGAQKLPGGILFALNWGYGFCWYGDGTITLSQADIDNLQLTTAERTMCGIPDVVPSTGVVIKTCNSNSKGQGAQHYAPILGWVEDANLGAVLAGKLQSYEVPVQFINPNAGVPAGLQLNCEQMLGGMTYDPATKTLLISAPKADLTPAGVPNACPLVHGFKVTF